MVKHYVLEVKLTVTSFLTGTNPERLGELKKQLPPCTLMTILSSFLPQNWVKRVNLDISHALQERAEELKQAGKWIICQLGVV